MQGKRGELGGLRWEGESKLHKGRGCRGDLLLGRWLYEARQWLSLSFAADQVRSTTTTTTATTTTTTTTAATDTTLSGPGLDI